MGDEKVMRLFCFFLFFCSLALQAEKHGGVYQDQIKPFLQKYCVECHGKKKTKGEINFYAIDTEGQALKKFEYWEKGLEAMQALDMPPEDEPQPSEKEVEVFEKWYVDTFVNIRAQPGLARLQRLSVFEYRESLKSLLGFDLELSVQDTGATRVETSMVLKMMPPDPPGESGFSNDMVNSPLTETIWEKYTFIANTAIENLFSPEYQKELEVYVGKIQERLTEPQALELVKGFSNKAFKSLSQDKLLSQSLEKVKLAYQKSSDPEVELKNILKAVLLSPQFLYKYYYTPRVKGEQRLHDNDLAQKLSYFLWGTLPDEELLSLAYQGKLKDNKVLLSQTERMLKDPRAKFFMNTFMIEWLALDEIKKSRERLNIVNAYFGQPLEFFEYLVNENRPLMEVLDSRVTYANAFLSPYYAKQDMKTLPRFAGKKGIEVEDHPLHRMTIENTPYRGGVLTMPGILKMYSGKDRTSPILRGIWVLERILGDELAEPPMDVPPIPKPKKGENLSFRQKFEMHQKNPNCSVCHSKIDPLGFGLENFDGNGHYRKSSSEFDSSGKTPDGDEFSDFYELKNLMLTKYRGQIIHTLTEKMFSYALARKLEVHDRPVINKIVDDFDENNRGYTDLVKAIVTSLPFTHTFVQ